VAEVQKVYDRGSVIRDCVLSLSLDHFVHSARTQGCAEDFHDGSAGIDVCDDLVLTLGIVDSIPKEEDLGLQHVGHLYLGFLSLVIFKPIK
jgi:hypothetical protein